MQFSPYLFFSGDCEEAFGAYERLFGGKILSMARVEDAPDGPPGGHKEDWKKKIMNIQLDIGGQVLMGSDSPPEYFSTPQGFYVAVAIPDEQKAEKIFNALADGGEMKMPMQPTFFAKKFGMLVDRFGTPWMINCAEAK